MEIENIVANTAYIQAGEYSYMDLCVYYYQKVCVCTEFTTLCTDLCVDSNGIVSVRFIVVHGMLGAFV